MVKAVRNNNKPSKKYLDELFFLSFDKGFLKYAHIYYQKPSAFVEGRPYPCYFDIKISEIKQGETDFSYTILSFLHNSWLENNKTTV